MTARCRAFHCANLCACLLALILASPHARAGGLACPLPWGGLGIFAAGFEVPAADPLAAPGPFATASQSGQTSRAGRDTPWSAVYPSTAGSYPLLLFAPGFQIPSAAYQNWIEHLASWGFVAVRADPPATLFNASHPDMALDLRAVLDDLLAPDALTVGVDGTRVAMAGHSLGGKLAVMVADADARISAVFALDPVNGTGTAENPDVLPEAVESLGIPLGFLGELTDSEGAMACAPLALNYQTFFEAADDSPEAYEWTLVGADHADFVTNPELCGSACSFCGPGTLDAAVTHSFMRASAVAFLRTHLLGAGGLCGSLTGDLLPTQVLVRQSSAP
jgi:dienelactone hydrolase